MPKGSHEHDKPEPAAAEHGPLRAERIPRDKYAPKFLSDLKARNQVAEVEENWDAGGASPPRNVDWVVYPNGDLERVGFS